MVISSLRVILYTKGKFIHNLFKVHYLLIKVSSVLQVYMVCAMDDYEHLSKMYDIHLLSMATNDEVTCQILQSSL